MAGTGRALDADEVARELVGALSRALPGRLSSVVAHGSWVHGDFDPSRSDVDLLAVLVEDPTSQDVDRLSAQLSTLFARRPAWVDRVEVGLVTREAVQDVVEEGCSARAVGRISPGEPLHLAPAERRRLLDWEAAARGQVLHAAPDPLGPVPWPLVRQVLLEELVAWPGWLDEAEDDDVRAYAVLTVARSATYAATGVPHSKRAGARWLAGQEPRWRELLEAADATWYGTGPLGGLDPSEVAELVRELARRADGAGGAWEGR
ncbi:MAG: aminoglycoside adenylyltransferase domain-containing protein [Motilibacteraceae bacterium]